MRGRQLLTLDKALIAREVQARDGRTVIQIRVELGDARNMGECADGPDRALDRVQKCSCAIMPLGEGTLYP